MRSVNAGFTKIIRTRPKQVAVFDAAVTRDTHVATRLKINSASPETCAPGLMLPAESSTFTKVLTLQKRA